MLVPLQGSLPGWPPAPEPSTAGTLLIILGIPLAIGLVVAFLGKGVEYLSGPPDTAASLEAVGTRRELPASPAGGDELAGSDRAATAAPQRSELTA